MRENFNQKESHMRKVFSRRSPIAKDLGTAKYRPRVVRDKRKYTRKGHKNRDSLRRIAVSFYPGQVNTSNFLKIR
jgi:hypothetical protein